MSVDRNDFSKEVMNQKRGASPSFWPIVVSPDGGGFGGGQMDLNVEYEINVNPCDHIWLPTFFDPSIAINPCQSGGASSRALGNAGTLPFQGPNALALSDGAGGARILPGYPKPVLGMNVFDVWDQAEETQDTEIYGGGYAQQAAIFLLKFNSQNAPWLLWTLGDLLSQSATSFQLNGYAGINSTSANYAATGQGDSMRSISGPISRMWVKYLQWANYCYGGASVAMPVFSPAASQIVLFSTLGFSELTAGAKYPGGTGGEIAFPNTFSLNGGGYVTPQLNTIEQALLEQSGVPPQRKQP